MQITGKKLARYLLTAVLIIGVILALGFLSFTGMLTLCGLVSVALGSFAVTAMIEGEVYAQSIVQGIEKLLKGKWLKNKHLNNAIYVRELNKLLKNNCDNSELLNQYSRHVATLEKLKHQKEKLGLLYFFSAEFKQAFENAEKLVAEDQKHFIALIEQHQPSDENDYFHGIDTIAIRKEIADKSATSRWLLLAAAIAGIGMGLVFFSIAPESIVATATFFGIALSASAFPIGITIAIAILATMAAAGYMVLVDHTLTSMSQNDTLKKWMKKIKHFFSPSKKNLSGKAYFFWLAKKIAVGTGIMLLVAICAFATITTAGTWWYAAQAGVTFILPQLEKLAVLLSAPLVVVMGLGQLGFNLYNSLKTASIIKKWFNRSTDQHDNNDENEISDRLDDDKESDADKKTWLERINIAWEASAIKKKYYDQETPSQFFNPFRAIAALIALPFKFLVFLGHIASSAVMGDRFKPIPVEACVVPGAIVEITSDAPFFIDEHDNSHGKKHVHSDHEHSHTDIPGKVLSVVLSPLHLLSALWDFCCGAEKTWEAGKKSLIKAFFGIDAWDIWSGQQAIVSTLNTEADYKTASVNKINRLLNNVDKVKQLSEDQKEFFRSLSSDLSNYNHKTYTAIFSDAKQKLKPLCKDDTEHEHAKNFLTKVMCF